MLTHRGIEANPDKCHAIIDMRILTSVKHVQKLTGRITSLSNSLSCAGDKSIHFFITINKSTKFIWTEECEKEFGELKKFLSAPPILVRPKENSPLNLYLAVSDKEIILVLVQDSEGDEIPVYFFSKVLKGAKIWYQEIEWLALVVVVTARKLRLNFQVHPIIVKTNNPIKWILKKSDLARRMVAWAVELFKYDIIYVPINNIKSQVLENFLI